jgi:ribosome-associated translation inhibitor RaiA
MRGLGIVTASHADADSYVAIDRAAALLEQAVLRKLREAGGHGSMISRNSTSR